MPASVKPSFAARARLTPRTVHLESSAVDGFPVLLTPGGGGTDPSAYVERERASIERLLLERGAVLLRGFEVRDAGTFSNTLARLAPDILSYSERSSPRHAVDDRVYTSTDHPADQEILPHSEQSYTLDWPCLICFFCQTAAAAGGATPIADNRRILRRLPTTLVDRFTRSGVLYKRTYSPGLGLSWQSAFGTDDPGDVEAFCAARDIETVWDAEGRLKTRQRRSAFQAHPVTGERLWFNHALFFHHTSLDPDLTAALVEAVGVENVPTDTTFGDGEPFSPDDLAAMREAVLAEKHRFTWQAGDVLILDNMLSQHGRDPFDGARRVLTLMARPYTSVGRPLLSPLASPHGI